MAQHPDSDQGGHGVALGMRALKGGAVVVGVAGERLVLSTFLATADPDDRLSSEPYALAFAMPRGTTSAQPRPPWISARARVSTRPRTLVRVSAPCAADVSDNSLFESG